MPQTNGSRLHRKWNDCLNPQLSKLNKKQNKTEKRKPDFHEKGIKQFSFRQAIVLGRPFQFSEYLNFLYKFKDVSIVSADGCRQHFLVFETLQRKINLHVICFHFRIILCILTCLGSVKPMSTWSGHAHGHVTNSKRGDHIARL